MATFVTIARNKGSGFSNFKEDMQRYPFIFSNERKWRFRRHFLFWTFWWLFQAFLYSFVIPNNEITYFQRLPLSVIESFFYLIPHIFLAYSLIYWVIPRILLKGNYIKTAFAVCTLFICTSFLSVATNFTILNFLRDQLNRTIYVPPVHYHDTKIYLAFLAGLRGGITIGGIAAAIKLMKYWYVKEQNNLQLQKENAEARLQLLQAQVHPHFLFNTLNNIYSYTQNTSPTASKLVIGLSDLLRYMLYECSQPVVPLSNELKMLENYITLEQVRYDSGFDVNLDLPENTDGFFIAPLLLLPFVENCFKHGTSHMLEQAWISLEISMEENQMKMKLLNGKAKNKLSANKTEGIGISNVRKRLEILYPGKHQLKIMEEDEVFIVNLKIDLERPEGVKIKFKETLMHERQ